MHKLHNVSSRAPLLKLPHPHTCHFLTIGFVCSKQPSSCFFYLHHLTSKLCSKCCEWHLLEVRKLENSLPLGVRYTVTTCFTMELFFSTFAYRPVITESSSAVKPVMGTCYFHAVNSHFTLYFKLVHPSSPSREVYTGQQVLNIERSAYSMTAQFLQTYNLKRL